MHSDAPTPDELTIHSPESASPVPKVVKRRSLIRWAGVAFAVSPLALGARTLLGLRSTSSMGSMASMAPEATTSDGRLRRWSMIIDLRFCDGCQRVGKPPQCTEACILGHLVPEPMEWIQVYEQDLPGNGTRFVPTPCQQCQNPPCGNVCPVGATFSTPEGNVLIDQQRCIGCRICMAACPYDRRFFNWSTPPQPTEAQAMTYSIEAEMPAIKGTVMKCSFCPHLTRAGRIPHCADACPNYAIYFGDLEEDVATNGKSVIQISRFLAENSAFRLNEEYGTEPRVYYIPGQGEAVGRSASRKGRLATVWPWTKVADGSQKWTR
jgi:molybdopterin-containing oxidoreductase family iron-sulfur binding subunit